MKKVAPNERRQSSSDGRGDLLSEIRTGKQLKKVRKQPWALKTNGTACQYLNSRREVTGTAYVDVHNYVNVGICVMQYIFLRNIAYS